VNVLLLLLVVRSEDVPTPECGGRRGRGEEGGRQKGAAMPAGHGLRSRTRDLFSRPFRHKGYIHLTTYLRNYKIGDYVDIKVNGAVHKGMPHKFYHGRTGIVWNVTKRAVGVVINKQVGHRIIQKRLHVRIEHVQPSRCREDFLERRKMNDRLKAEAKARGEKVSTKRQPAGPKAGFVLDASTLQTVTPIPYDVVNDLKGGY
jgi:large subunit ribosomal protein L21e